MSISFSPTGVISCNSIDAYTGAASISFSPDYEITAKKVYINTGVSAPYFDSDYGVHCNGLILPSGARPQLNGKSFDDLFEKPYGSFSTSTLSGVSPTVSYITNYAAASAANPNAGGQYTYNGTTYDAAPRGCIASNTIIATLTATNTWIRISKGPEGIRVTTNGSNVDYANEDRGEYPYTRIGLLFCGGGGGGGCGYYGDDDDSRGGGGGGGGGVCLCTLWLDSYTYYLYLGTGGAGAPAVSGSTAGAGTASVLRKDSSSGTILATCNGGSAASYRTGGAGGTVTYSYSGTYFQFNKQVAGGAGGNGGSEYGYSPTKGGNCTFTNGYINGISNASCNVTNSGGAGGSYPYSGDIIGGGGGGSIGGGGSSPRGGGSDGNPGDRGSGGSGGSAYVYGSYGPSSAGGAGGNGIAYLYY